MGKDDVWKPFHVDYSLLPHLSFRVAVAILVLVPQCKLLWVILLNLLIGHLLANPLRRQIGRVKNTQLSFSVRHPVKHKQHAEFK